jgi:hypothetical protein
MRLLYLALRNVTKNWGRQTVLWWKGAINRFYIIYEDRIPADHRPC